MAQLEATRNVFAREIKRVQHTLPLKHASNFPIVLKKWKLSIDKHIDAGGSFDIKAPSRQQQFAQPSTAHYLEHYFDPWPNPVDGQEYTIELARFPVPIGRIGIVRKLFQWLSNDYAAQTDWGNPIKGVADIDGIIWHLRLESYLGLQPDRLISISPHLPGIAYPDLPEIRYLWFLPQAGASDLNLVIPGGYMLRFIAIMPVQRAAVSILGKLAGFWQSTEYSPEASANARKGF